MDLREKKTRRSITNAFLQLRSKKPLERITVKELAQLAEVSKATFYLHYRDIYDLCEQLQAQTIQDILAGLPCPEHCLTDNCAFTEALFCAFYANQTLLEVLFSGTQSAVLPLRVEQALCDFMRQRCPDLDAADEMRLTYTIHGGYAVYQKYCRQYDAQQIIPFVGRAAQAVAAAKKESAPV